MDHQINGHKMNVAPQERVASATRLPTTRAAARGSSTTATLVPITKRVVTLHHHHESLGLSGPPEATACGHALCHMTSVLGSARLARDQRHDASDEIPSPGPALGPRRWPPLNAGVQLGCRDRRRMAYGGGSWRTETWPLADVSPGFTAILLLVTKRPQQDSNLCSRLRRPSGLTFVTWADQRTTYRPVRVWTTGSDLRGSNCPRWIDYSMITLMRKKVAVTAIGACAVLMLSGGAAYAASSSTVVSSGIIHGCVSRRVSNGTRLLMMRDASRSCPRATTDLDWNQQGPTGPKGATGPAGPTGATGPQGPAGISGYQFENTVGTLDPGVVTEVDTPCPNGDFPVGGGY